MNVDKLVMESLQGCEIVKAEDKDFVRQYCENLTEEAQAFIAYAKCPGESMSSYKIVIFKTPRFAGQQVSCFHCDGCGTSVGFSYVYLGVTGEDYHLRTV